MNLKTPLILASLGIATALSTGVAHAAIVTYTDQTTFLAQLDPGYFLDNFNDVTNGGIIAPSATRSGNGYSVTYSAPPGGLYSIAGGMATSAAIDNLIATLGAGIYAVGGNFFLTDLDGVFQAFPGSPVSAFASNGIDPDAMLSVAVNSATTFFGWISTTPLTTVTVNSGGATPNRWNTLDNFVVGVEATPSSVAEPGTLSLLALAGLAAARRRRTRCDR